MSEDKEVNIAPLASAAKSEAGKKVLSTLADWLGYPLERFREGSKRKALRKADTQDSKATIERVSAIEASDLDENIKNELIAEQLKLPQDRRRAFIEERRQRNLETISALACTIEQPHTSKNPVQQDWLAKWIGFSQDVEDRSVQDLWATLLSQEVAAPGSYSLRTLAELSTYSRQDAELAQFWSKFAMHEDNKGYMLLHQEADSDVDSEVLNATGPGFDNLLRAIDRSIFMPPPLLGVFTANENEPLVFQSYGTPTSRMKVFTPHDKMVSVISATSVGHEILKLAAVESDSSYIDSTQLFLAQLGFRVELAKGV